MRVNDQKCWVMLNTKMKIIGKYFSAIWIVSIAFLVEAEHVQIGSKPLTSELIHGKPPFEGFKVEAEVYSEGEKTLHLKITWDQNSTNDSIFHVLVNPIERELCHFEACNTHGEISYNATLFVPTKPPSSEEIYSHECEISPGCNYTVTVESDNYESEVIYRVPDPVGNVYSCHHAMELPHAKTSARMRGDELIIDWTISESFNVPSDIQVFVVVLITNLKDIKNVVEVFNHTLTSTNPQCGEFKWKVTSEDANYLTRTFIYDSHGCSSGYPFVAAAKANQEEPKPKVQPVQLKWLVIAVLSFGSAIILLVIPFIYYYRTKTKKPLSIGLFEQRTLPPGLTMELNPDYEELHCPPYEIPSSSIQIIRKIGDGAFGNVFFAKGRDICGIPGLQNIAVKQLKRPSDEQRNEFVLEIETMKKVSHHPNIVALLGFCTIKGPLRIVMEYVGCGDLKSYLLKLREKLNERYGRYSHFIRPFEPTEPLLDPPSGKYLEIMNSSTSYTSDGTASNENVERPSVTETMYTTLSSIEDTNFARNQLEYVLDHNELRNFATQIARGLEHLHKMKITHRDLAARNILIDEEKTLKISDFGLSRSGDYVHISNRVVPLRWLSIEAIRNRFYSEKSDVWAYAVVLWEIGSLGGHPYYGVDNDDILVHLTCGKRLPKPENCSKYLYDLMLSCWAYNPEDRPSVSNILEKLEPHEQCYVDFSEISSDYVFPPAVEQENMEK
ncbi:Vascular endothelial growth factor receptor 1 [Pseudolycoriella hygida]|uniref:Vascular endothelial growth factor receptor 1 n=1 Tax=Pseudolycoriella hygida TaxID=35572 RepID=A0A9Q0S910_9DIPT|nr:Vascular endothelial growth factor receptor 1 [Pseudolycoriella hygida]